MKVAIVCDWLVGGGAERVVYALHEIYPDAPIFTSYISESQRKVFSDADVHVLSTAKIPFSGKLRKLLPMLRERAFEKLDLSDYDVVLSASGAEAKGVRTPESTLHIDYCHSPTHYYWVRYKEYLQNPGLGLLNPLARIGLKGTIKARRKWDYTAAQQADVMIANSTITAQRIAKYYKRDSVVIFPPVDTDRFSVNKSLKREGFVVAGRQTPYKRIDIAVEAATSIGAELHVVGDGPEHDRLQRIAGDTITFHSQVSDAEMSSYFQTARGFLFTGVEDFGITPVEAMLCGTPVIAYKAGGALDSVVEGVSGTFFSPQTSEALANVLRSFEESAYKPDTIRKHAEQFSSTHFKKSIEKLVQTELAKKASTAKSKNR